MVMTRTRNYALQRIRRERRGCNRTFPSVGSLRLGRSDFRTVPRSQAYPLRSILLPLRSCGSSDCDHLIFGLRPKQRPSFDDERQVRIGDLRSG